MKSFAVLSASAGKIELGDRELPEPDSHSVRVRVEACGICHSDALTVHGAWPGIAYPRVPGHEIAGRIDALGDEVEQWRLGDRVGIGWHGGHCQNCDRCRRGDFLSCRSLQIPGISYDGGYAQYVVAPTTALARIPDALGASEAAPLMCAGVTTFNALRHSGAVAGDVVAILGVGGLGHLGVQYAAKMGFETVAIARGAAKRDLALDLGAQHYIDSEAGDYGAALQKLGGAKVVLATTTSAKAMEPAMGGLAVDGVLLIVGASMEPFVLNTAAMIGGRHSVKAWASGTCVDSEEAMAFSLLTGVRARVEERSLDDAPVAYERMMSGNARFRVVLTT
ncbi:MAG TPA: alcohol dehydrogenase catalytic domain-containing protein [Candidatus Dormibacteraeota bacterium]|nr:alcohol dehydrogenase catalytic domain-containing protein [Candidatus Dormibacteraeota bacterium]